MGLFRRKGKSSEDTRSETQELAQHVDPELQEQAQEVMKDNLELMKDVVMRIREDPDFASNIYADCPRLQHLLDQYPDLRPIFEDPKLVRINFEQVYRDAGGILPEDEKKKKSWLVWFVNSPIFKVLKLVLFVKKLVACIAGGGFAFLSGCLMGCCFEDALEELEDAEDGDADGDAGIDPAKEALNRAADHMEDPEVQEQMQALLEDPDNLQEAIENDSELRALRDSNALCEELMSDPETMRVLTDPDNLRALGECPQLIEADFIDPEGFMPSDIETGGLDGLGDTGYDAFDGVDMEYEADNDFEAESEFEDEDDIEADDNFEEEEEEGWWEDAEMEEQEIDNDGGGDNNQNAGNKGKGQAKSQAKNSRAQQAQNGNNGRFGGIMASIGVAATDLIAAQIVGNVFGADIMPGGDMMGGGGMGGVDNKDTGGGGFDDVGNAADNAGRMIDDDLADVAEDTMEKTQDKVDEKEAAKLSESQTDVNMDDDGKKKTAGVAGGAAAGGVVVGGAATTRSRSADDGSEQGAEEGFQDEEEEKPKKGRFRGLGKFAAAISTQAKEHIATAVLGDDWGEQLVEKMEDDDDESSSEDGKSDDDDKDKKKKKRGFFARGKNNDA